uniref:ATP synthase F0 subunit 6 n=1 Tax=Anagonalia emeiensis TaxID=2744606 RepID=UPI002410171F|nr:ATP synthase F0 subunit 6 [Anagonalia emeiensis]WEU75303.1 ATP synthase F0 subunit 6 [Anagonalia emeiensis]
MMTNLFSVFDPCTGTLSLNWMSIMILLFMFPMNFWLMKNKYSMFVNLMLNKLHIELNSLMKYKGMSMIMLTLFLIILYNNLMGLLPYVFTTSSHLLFSISLAMPMWVSFMLYSCINNTNMMLIHLVPMGTPSILMSFMVVIETISNLIRPGSLAVRLTANIIAGHLLMSLLGNNANNLIMISLLMIMFSIIMIFEMMIGMIQSYVFMTLMNLYSSEV